MEEKIERVVTLVDQIIDSAIEETVARLFGHDPLPARQDRRHDRIHLKQALAAMLREHEQQHNRM